ncbi:alpha/beta hydrolase [Ramlibacter ginsenosidimutans]|uniref:Alpha/beta hydrolase n=1 Tax=Ramlibacter ginsenosidimutans TaxID=502333 RepID=A0A934TRV9_9BURK|nr:alpha/beta hydrolase [Ramlibacter ginsenosidimutans]MBK6006210.1 alpha/beta hydrolase [Ramlibacter ginsenosidimutans]
MNRVRSVLAGLAVALPALTFAQAAEVVDLPTRAGVTERLLVLPNATPTAVAVLLTGGNGHLDIAGNGFIRRDANFLVRSRDLFAQQGFAVVVVDVPSDHASPPYLGGDFRASPEHAADLGAVVAWARGRFGKPVWVIGTSRGTQSAATAGLRLQGAQAPDGIVLTSTIMGRSRFGDSTAPPLTELDLTGLKQPVLVVHHAHDPCGVCPPERLPELMKHLPASAVLKTVDGGASRGAACDPWSHHGYNGIENQVVGAVAAWMREHQ